MCVEILVPTESPMMDTALGSVSSGVTQLARQIREFQPDIERVEVVSL